MERDIQSEKRLLSQLGKAELLQLLEIINDLQCIETDGELENLLQRAAEVASCDFSTCCLRRIDTEGVFLSSIKSVDGNFPRDWLPLYNGGAHEVTRLLPLAHHNQSRAIVWSQVLAQHASRVDMEIVERARNLGLLDGVTLATTSSAKGLGSLFSFSGSSIDNLLRSVLVLDRLAPFLHNALLRMAPREG